MRVVRPGRRLGFSLVEVVLAIGIVSFAVIVVLGLFASLSQRRREVSDSREATLAADALQGFLGRQTAFSNVYSWLSSSNTEFVYMTYRADPSGTPAITGSAIRSRWGTVSEDWTSYDAARDGALYKAVLNRIPGDALPALSAFTNAYVEARASVYRVPERMLAAPTNTRPSLTVPLVVFRK